VIEPFFLFTQLFAKHFKLGEHVKYLQKTKIGVGIGTPDRIGKLLSSQGTVRSAFSPFLFSKATLHEWYKTTKASYQFHDAVLTISVLPSVKTNWLDATSCIILTSLSSTRLLFVFLRRFSDPSFRFLTRCTAYHCAYPHHPRRNPPRRQKAFITRHT
jgi:hypothetical protein